MSESDARVAEILSEYQDRMTITGAGRAARELAVALARSEEEAADASASLRELQMAAAELVNHWTNAGGVCLECLQPAEGHRGNCLAGRLAALLPVPAEGAKGGG
jgi:hypothetical protein